MFLAVKLVINSANKEQKIFVLHLTIADMGKGTF